MSAGRAQEVLTWTVRSHRRVALVASFQAESGVLIDMVHRLGLRPDVLTIDTGRLPAETHRVIEEFRRRYHLALRILRPDPAALHRLVDAHGPDLFRDSVELRHRCCEVRKVRPLEDALRHYDAWITGLRRDQSPARSATAMVTADDTHGGITKVAPLVDWSRDDVWNYLERHAVPRHPLYTQGYTSIGCAPCTRATTPGEDERAGRWWWELESARECGLHTAVAQEVR